MTTDTKKIFTIGSVLVFFLIIVGFAIFGARGFIFGVKIKNVNLVDGTKSADSVIQVTGNAKNAVQIALNGREISVDRDGNFDETVALFSGYNIVQIEAKDKFGLSDKKNYKLIY